MLNKLIRAGAVAGFFCSVLMAQPSIAWMYEFHNIEFPGSVESFPLGINNNRDLSGTYLDTMGIAHGYTYMNGKFATVDYPGTLMVPGAGTLVGGINDRRDLVGEYYDAQGYQHGFIRTIPDGCDGDGDSHDSSAACKPVFKSIDVPGAAQTRVIFESGPGLGTNAIGLNNFREVAGLYAANQMTSAGYVLSNGRYQPINDPSAGKFIGDGSKLFGVNDFGLIVGDYITQTSASASALQITHGFVYDGRNFTSVYVDGSEKGGFGTQANGINLQGEVTGVFTDPAGSFHGLFWAGGQSFTLDYPGMPYSEVHGINNRRDITGAFSDAQMQVLHGFVAYLKN